MAVVPLRFWTQRDPASAPKGASKKMFDRRRFIAALAAGLATSAVFPGQSLAAHSGGRGGPPPGKGPGGGSDHHDDHDSSHELGHDDETHDDETHDDSHAEGGHESGGEEDEGKRGPRYKGGRSVANLKSGFGHSFTSESVIFRH